MQLHTLTAPSGRSCGHRGAPAVPGHQRHLVVPDTIVSLGGASGGLFALLRLTGDDPTREERRVRAFGPSSRLLSIGFVAGHLVARTLRCADDRCWDVVTLEAVDGCDDWELPPGPTDPRFTYSNLVVHGDRLAWIEPQADESGLVRLYDVATRSALPLEPPIATWSSGRMLLDDRFLLLDRRDAGALVNVARDLVTGEEQTLTQYAQTLVVGDGIAVGANLERAPATARIAGGRAPTRETLAPRPAARRRPSVARRSALRRLRPGGSSSRVRSFDGDVQGASRARAPCVRRQPLATPRAPVAGYRPCSAAPARPLKRSSCSPRA